MQTICNLVLSRRFFSDSNTIGRLYLNNTFFCYTQEPNAINCIPCGDYNIRINLSLVYGKICPCIKGVIGFDNIRILPASKVNDNTGSCILVCAGYNMRTETMTDSSVAFNNLMKSISKFGAIHLSVKNNNNIDYV